MRYWLCVLALMIGMETMPAVHAAAPLVASTEVDTLLEAVEDSDCQFYRNGRWYGASAAQSHLREKYDLLARANRIKTAEDFIDKAATKSSLSGRAYAIKCTGAEAVGSSEWLREVLAGYRNLDAQHAPCGEHLGRVRAPQSSG